MTIAGIVLSIIAVVIVAVFWIVAQGISGEL